MNIKPSFAHPSWCDPRTCHTLGVENVDHRSTPLTMKSTVDDYRLTVGLARFDGIGPFPHTGSDTVHLEVFDLVSDHPDGSDRLIDTDLSAADARLLAAALVCAAEQLEALGMVSR